MPLDLLGDGTGTVGTLYWALWNRTLGFLGCSKHSGWLGNQTGLAGMQPWVCWSPAVPLQLCQGVFTLAGQWAQLVDPALPSHPIPESPTELPPGCSAYPAPRGLSFPIPSLSDPRAHHALRSLWMKAGAGGSMPVLCQEDASKIWENGCCSCAKMPFSFKKREENGKKLIPFFSS